jgi:endonuclease-3 related protein
LDNEKISQQLKEIYRRLFAAFGPQHWWPADEPFEVMVGAILTQSVAWRNVEQAITNLKAAGALSPRALRRLSVAEIAPLVRPCIYYNIKARKLKALVEWFEKCCRDDLNALVAMETADLRRRLLSVWGIGEETADSIVLYAAGKPVFVIDAYTRRIIDRVGLKPNGNSYGAYQSLFAGNLPEDARLFNEYHALLVRLGKNICRSHPLCNQCCLNSVCRFGLETVEKS